MKFQELVLLAEQTPTLPIATQSNPVYSTAQQQYKPNQGATPTPKQDPTMEGINNLINSLVNPVQIAIDAYNLGQDINTAYSRYAEEPTPGNALGFLAVAGLGLISIKTGGKSGVAGGERIEAAAEMAEAIRGKAADARAMATLTKYLEGMKDLFTPNNVDELAAAQGMSREQLDNTIKRATQQADESIAAAEKAIESSPLRTQYEVALDNIKNTKPSSSSSKLSSIKDAPKTAITPTTKINWETSPGLDVGEAIQASLNKIPKTDLRGAKLGEYLKNRPEIDDIAKQNGITPEQVKSYIDYSFNITPPVTPALTSITVPRPGKLKPTTAAQRTANTGYRSTTPEQRAANTRLSRPPSPAAATGALTPEALDQIKAIVRTEVAPVAKNAAASVPLRVKALRSIAKFPKQAWNNLDDEEKMGIQALAVGLATIFIAGPVGAQLGIAFTEEKLAVLNALKEFLNGFGSDIKNVVYQEVDKNINELTDKKQKLTQSLASAGWRPEQIQRMTASLDEQIRQAQSLKKP